MGPMQRAYDDCPNLSGQPVSNYPATFRKINMTKQKTIQNLSRNFVIPAGTQVVLQVSKQPVATADRMRTDNPGANKDSGTVKKSGTVGVVIKCPPHNDLPYIIRFTDGSCVEASFDEVVLRRQEVENLLAVDPDLDLLPYTIYRCQVGSKAFGLSHEDSDDDYRGIFLPPAELDWSLYKLPEQIESNDGQNDEVYWELGKFLRLALKANPNILETLWSPIVIQAEPIARQLLEIRQVFLSKHIYKTYSGYVLSQFRRMRNAYEKTGKYKTKHAMHLLRLLHSGIGALETGEIMIDVSSHRDTLMDVRMGKYSFDQIRQQAMDLDRRFQQAFEASRLPDQPDFGVVNQFLISARRSMVDR